MNHKQHETVGKHTQKSADEQQGASTSRKLAKALSVDTSNRAEQPEYDHREKIELVSRIFDNFRDPYSIVGVLPNDDIDKIKDRFLSKYNTLCRDPHHPGDSTRPLFQAARDSKHTCNRVIATVTEALTTRTGTGVCIVGTTTGGSVLDKTKN
jgi:hypothetical protein